MGDLVKITGHLSVLCLASFDEMVKGDAFSGVLACRKCPVHLERMVLAARTAGRCRVWVGASRIGCLRTKGDFLAIIVERQLYTRRGLVFVVHFANLEETDGVNLREVGLKGKTNVMRKDHFHAMIALFFAGASTTSIADQCMKFL